LESTFLLDLSEVAGFDYLSSSAVSLVAALLDEKQPAVPELLLLVFLVCLEMCLTPFLL